MSIKITKPMHDFQHMRMALSKGLTMTNSLGKEMKINEDGMLTVANIVRDLAWVERYMNPQAWQVMTTVGAVHYIPSKWDRFMDWSMYSFF